jgi:hypothetical protein
MGNMMGGNQPEKLWGVKVNSSELGHPVTVVMGTAAVNQSFFWIDGFSSAPLSKQSAGGKGGGKSGQFLYSADVVAGLCAGPINGIGDMWTGQSWLTNPNAAEAYSIASPFTYTPVNAATSLNDKGVSPSATISSTHNDFGAPGATTLSASTTTPYTRVAFGTALASGQYSINPATGQYNFSPANTGQTVTVNYTFQLQYIDSQETDIIPSSTQQIQVGGTFQFNADLGVVYGGTGANTGEALTKVNGSPTVTGTYSQSGSGPATYFFAPGDVGL